MRKYFSIFTLLLIITLLLAFGVPPIGNWYQQGFPSIGDKTINDITFIDSLNGFAIASKNVNPDSSVILKTTNGGDNWSIVFAQQSRKFSRVIFLNLTTGYVSGGTGSGTPYVYKTTDAGANWNLIPTPSTLYFSDMSVINNDTIFLVDNNILNGGIYRTTNSGVSWTQQFNAGPTKIYMYNARIGFITNGQDNFFKTTNSGINWSAIPGGSFFDIKFIDSLTGWKARGSVLKTTDGGLNWQTQTLPQAAEIITNSIEKLYMLNKDTLWGVGGFVLRGSSFYGMIYKTTNGGNNWGYQINDTSIHITRYSFIQFTDKLKGWAYSSFPTAGGIHTKTGGLDTTIFTKINQPGTEIVSDFKLFQNYPNPFNPTTNINYELRNTSYVSLKVYDLQGKEIQTLVNKKQNAGNYTVEFNGSNLSSGIYFYTLQTENYKETKKMMLIK